MKDERCEIAVVDGKPVHTKSLDTGKNDYWILPGTKISLSDLCHCVSKCERACRRREGLDRPGIYTSSDLSEHCASYYTTKESSDDL